MAQLRGKLPPEVWLDSEDLLTSAVFGSLKNLPASVTASILGEAQPVVGSSPPVPHPPFHWLFWPRWETCEPDVVIEDERNLYVIEAKLYSEFSEDSGAGTQLRREWSDGWKRSQDAGKGVWLITITNHASPPWAEIRRQLARTSADLSHVCWLGWSRVSRLVQTTGTKENQGWCEDLLELLARMGLVPFDGFGQSLEASAPVPIGVPWAEETLFGVDILAGEPSFGAAVECALLLRGSSARPWTFQRLGGSGSVGFAGSLARARTHAQRGGIQWQPKLK